MIKAKIKVKDFLKYLVKNKIILAKKHDGKLIIPAKLYLDISGNVLSIKESKKKKHLEFTYDGVFKLSKDCYYKGYETDEEKQKKLRKDYRKKVKKEKFREPVF